MTPGHTPAVTVVGSINLDTTLRVTSLPGPGETTLSTAQLVAPGGKGGNQAAAAAWGGATVRFVGSVGDDAAADAATANLRALGVELSGLERAPDAPTGSAVLLVADDAENVIIVTPGANRAVDPAGVAAALSAHPPTVLLTQLETPLAVTAVCAAQPTVPWRVLNPAPAGDAAALAPLLPGFNVVIPNRTELGQLAGRQEPRSLDEVAACVAALAFAGTVIVTLGADGAAVWEPGARTPLVLPPPAVTPVDTSGAGDVFCGVFAAELARHGDVAAAAAAAVAASAASTERSGAQLGPGALTRVRS
ncbi:PfkB family carbohydrate kinase [Leucobacter chromiireducens]|uniref:Ribokinase n=1 Tax=Leucobacter chromiireducens subsp. solipictus TaxID=398235 RepID=A0ABS1SH81_9MICO|nr:PfkB family carbohydrate kinase [Leucobacter chromiireducens]MBL3679932.1 ribokinase [Leucobacter chromiireducens subsp. solipictus]